MKLLVTGGAGFIGANFILYWFRKYPQDKIVNLDCLTYAGNLANLEKVKNNSNYSFIKGNINPNLNIKTSSRTKSFYNSSCSDAFRYSPSYARY